MSGITGIIYNNALEDTQDINKMSKAIAHRGPDAEGFLAISTKTGKVTELSGEQTPVSLPPLSDFGSNADVYLAHRRLSIVDTSNAGHQPMANEKKDIWIIFNGEIYNYKSLKNELTEFHFKSNTDTEVLLYAYEKWGINCLQRLNGMWSFVIYDVKKNILFGSRDRFGVRPLYYAHTSDFFAFSSEIKGLLANDRVSRKVNMNAAVAYLRAGLDSSQGETFFNDVSELQPSHYFVFDLGNKNLTIDRYYEIPFCDTWESFDEKKCSEYIEGTKDRIMQALDLRLNTDVSIGSCLSGGLDSSAIVCSVDQLNKKSHYNSVGSKLKVVTSCYKNSPADESKWAQYVVDHTSSDWYRVFPKQEDLFNDLSDLIYTQDVPFGSTSIYAQYRVMKAAKEAGITVLFDGQGGDELFTGYTPYYNMFYSELKKHGEFDLLANEQKYIQNTPLNEVNIDRMLLKTNIKSLAKKILPQPIINIIRAAKQQPEMKYISAVGRSYKQYSYNTLNQMLYTLMSYTALPQVLKYEDRNSMRFGIESRSPFADDINLIEYVFKMPGVYKIHNGWSKYLLRESMENIIPKQIKERTDKIGFATPETEWLKTIKPLVFDGDNSFASNILAVSQMEKDWDKIIASQTKVGITNIWRYINLILWFKAFKVTV
jgi:asparagine synthase (glutamine-hydrolysing)